MVSLEVFIDLMFPAAWPRGQLILYTEMSTRNISWIKIRRLEWVGNIIRMEYEIIPKKVLNGSFTIQEYWENQEQDGSSLDEHITDTRVKMMEETSKNREEWKHLLKEARVQKGL